LIACAVFGLGGVVLMASNLWGSPTPLPPTETAISIPPTSTNEPLPTATIPPVNTGSVLLEDDFSDDSRWGTLTDTDSSVEYQNNALNMRIFRENFVIWSTPNDQDYDNVHMEVTVINNDTDPTTAFGFICAQQTEDWSFYYLAVTPGREYAIIKATDGESDVFLTGSGQWASSNAIASDASSYRVGADCGNGQLTLYVDGRQVASVTDNSYNTGRVGLFTWSGEKAPSANVTFDDFLLTAPE
jgi:hypothetical protein